MDDRKESIDSSQQFERKLRDGITFELCLYVAGTSIHSLRAVEAINRLCKGVLKDCCRLCIIDIYETPELAGKAQIVAVPTLVRVEPLPVRKLVGDLSDRGRLLRFLGFPSLAREGTA